LNNKYVLNGLAKEVPQIEFPSNQILYGPPGTGKTFHTINKSVKIADNLSDEKFESKYGDYKNRKELIKRFDELRDKGQIGFTTFHQSMSYEDFIEGIKPKMNSANIEYEIKDGIFKEISGKAYYNIIDEKENEGNISFDSLWDNFLESIKSHVGTEDYIFETITGKRLKLVEISSTKSLKTMFEFDGSSTNTPGTTIQTIGMPKVETLLKAEIIPSEVKSLAEQIRPLIKSDSSKYFAVYRKFYEFVEKTYGEIEDIGSNEIDFKSVFDTAEILKKTGELKDKISDSKNFVLIIDEINRGNISQIFGELITLLEKDKRFGNEESLTVELPYSKGQFSVPPNLYIIGTMNTADRSIEALDTALRRRFTFQEMPPRPNIIKTEGVLKSKDLDTIDLVKLLKGINQRIEKLIDKDHKIGHSYFMKVKNLKGLKNAFKDKIIPLLEEYFYGNFGKIGLVLGDDFVQEEQNSTKFRFANFSGYDSELQDDLKQRKVYKFTKRKYWTLASFIPYFKEKTPEKNG